MIQPPPASVALDAVIRRPRVVRSVAELVGRTPLLRLRRLEPHAGVELWAKAEFMNPGGSVKDRAALFMIQDGIASGRLTRDRVLIDSTSGNTGVAYSMLGAAMGIAVELVMPDNVSVARKQITRAYGTKIIYSSPLEGSDGAILRCKQLVAEHPERYFYPDQYANEANPGAHFATTGPEILAEVGDRITHFIAGIGTSGTVMGTSRRLKQARPSVRTIALEPEDALHGLEGLKHMVSSIVPPIWRPEECIDEIMPMATEEGWDVAERVARDEGVFIGHSAGGAVAGALRIARTIPVGERACIVTVLPDRGDRYFRPLKWDKYYVW